MIGLGVRCPAPVVGCLTLGEVVLDPSKVDQPPGLVKLIQIAVTNLVVLANNREGRKQHNV